MLNTDNPTPELSRLLTTFSTILDVLRSCGCSLGRAFCLCRMEDNNVSRVAAFFALALFFAPILTIVPPYAYGPALVVVGMFMMQSVTKFNFDDYSELLPAFLTIVLMIFTFNIGVGITAGFIAYVVLKLFTGRVREVRSGMWILAFLSCTFYLFYPYH